MSDHDPNETYDPRSQIFNNVQFEVQGATEEDIDTQIDAKMRHL